MPEVEEPPANAVFALSEIRAAREKAYRAQADEFRLIGDFADACSYSDEPDQCDLVHYGADGTPAVQEFASLELAAATGMSDAAAMGRIGAVLNVRHRLPHAWQAVQELKLRVWQAEQLDTITAELARDQARYVDERLAWCYGSMAWHRLRRYAHGLALEALPAAQADARIRREREKRRLVWMDSRHGVRDLWATLDAADAVFLQAQINRIAVLLGQAGNTDPLEVRQASALGLLGNPARALQLLQSSVLDGQPDLDYACPLQGRRGHTCGTIDVDPTKLLPKADLVVHVTEQSLANPEGGLARSPQLGALNAGRIREALAGCRVHIRPVLKVDHLSPADSYEVPAAMRESVALRNPCEVFPWSTRTGPLDYDHTRAYLRAEKAQTHPDNLGPLTRKVHRAKTHAGWKLSQPMPGIFLWRTPEGFAYLVTQSGSWEIHDPTHALRHGRRAPATD